MLFSGVAHNLSRHFAAVVLLATRYRVLLAKDPRDNTPKKWDK